MHQYEVTFGFREPYQVLGTLARPYFFIPGMNLIRLIYLCSSNLRSRLTLLTSGALLQNGYSPRVRADPSGQGQAMYVI